MPMGDKIEVNGRTFQIVPHGRGLHRLLWWREPGASQVVGDFANEETALFAAGRFNPTGKTGPQPFAFGESLNDAEASKDRDPR